MASAGLLLVLLVLLVTAAAGRRLICWQALFQCQNDPDCAYAYGLYTEACAPVLPPGDPTGAGAAAAYARGRRCPSHCISALIQLNQTRQGPALEDCDCARDESCRATKRAIEPCLPRSGGASASGAAGGGGALGCTEARRRCERDPRCGAALSRYLAHCGKLFNGMRCTHECREVIHDMLLLPKALLLSDCVCDGLERPICEAVKENMDRLCFRQDPNSSGGSSPDVTPFDDYYYDDDDEEPEQPRTQHPPRRGPEVRGSDSSGTTLAALPALILILTLLPAWTLAAPILL